MRAHASTLAGLCAVQLFCWATLATAATDARVAEAVRNGQKDTVRALVKQGVDVNSPQPDGTTALHWAVRDNDIETTVLLIGAGANVSAANDYGVTPLSL